MRTRTVVLLLGAVVGLGIGVDLIDGADAGHRPPPMVNVAATTCAPAACARVCPRAAPGTSPRASVTAARRHGRLAWHCPRQGHRSATVRPTDRRRSPSPRSVQPSPHGSRTRAPALGQVPAAAGPG
jgi:hypothetical protein